jgi:hypothetical protein
VHERWELAAERDERTPVAVDDGLMDRINDASLRRWMSIPPRVAVDDRVAAASDLDHFIAGVDDDVRAELVSEGRERSVDRSLHRGEQLRTIEGVVPSRLIRQSRSTSRWVTETRWPCSRK